MKTNITLEEALKQVYKGPIKAVLDVSSNWSLFQPFQIAEKGISYFRLLEIPNYYHTSQQIYEKTLAKFPQYLHRVELILVERCFQCSYYLAKANKNIISLKNLIELRRDSSEKIEKEILYKFLQFTTKIKQIPDIQSLNLEEIGLTYDGKFILSKYLLFFKIKAEEESGQNTINQDIQRVLASLIMLNTSDQLDFGQLYSQCLENYGEQLLEVIKKTISYHFSSDDIMTYIQTIRSQYEYEKKYTLTDSFHGSTNSEPHGPLDESIPSDYRTESFISSSQYVKKKKQISKKKLTGFLAIFLILVGAAGFITYKFLGNHEIVCNEAEYKDDKIGKCLFCPQGCLSCVSGALNSCKSCMTGKVLTVKDQKIEEGECSENCKGSLIKQKNICFDPNL